MKKKIIVVCIAVGLMGLMNGRAQMVQESLTAKSVDELFSMSKQSVQDQAYNKAIKELEALKKAVRNIQCDAIAARLFPKQVGGYTLLTDAESKQNWITDRKTNLVRTYQGEVIVPDTVDPAVDASDEVQYKKALVRISNGDKLVVKITKAHQQGKVINEPGRIYEPIRYKGFRALVVFSEAKKFASLGILTGAAVVQIDLEGVTTMDDVQAFAEAMNLQEVLTVFGY